MANDRQDLLSEYIDESSIKEQTNFFLSQVKLVLDLIQKFNSTKITLSNSQGILDTAKAAKELKSTLDLLSRSTDILTSNQGKQSAQAKVQSQDYEKATKAIKEQTTAIKENIDASNGISVIKPVVNTPQVTESNGIAIQQPVANVQTLKELNAQYKVLQQNTKDIILTYGAESDQAKSAAAAENALKDKIDALSQSYKNLIQQSRDASIQKKEIPSSVSVIQPSVQPETIEENGISIQNIQRETTSLKELNAEYKLLQQNTKQAILSYGSESDQAKVAASSEAVVKEKIDALMRLTKN